MAQQTWTQAFYWMARYCICAFMSVLAGIILPMHIWSVTGQGWFALTGLVLGPLAGWFFQPTHMQGTAQLLYEVWRLTVDPPEDETEYVQRWRRQWYELPNW